MVLEKFQRIRSGSYRLFNCFFLSINANSLSKSSDLVWSPYVEGPRSSRQVWNDI
jgi:hypothetical protein